jgi:hypothetical protein
MSPLCSGLSCSSSSSLFSVCSIFLLLFYTLLNCTKAYLTNPSENSFRAYLTEQSFRHHLSRLDDADDNNLPLDRFHSQTSPKNSTSSFVPATGFAAENAPSFHFANRASISLRTPKHVFHSFAIFTIAAILPTSESSNRERHDVGMISDSWYIGAFGKWWKGGVLEEWYQDVIARSKDEESWTSGILNMKRLDMLQDYKGLSFLFFLYMPPVKLSFLQRPPSMPTVCLSIFLPALLRD